MGANSRNKGAAFERQIARELLLATGITFKRDLEQYRASDHGDLIPDDPDWPFVLELKRYADGVSCRTGWKTQARKAADAVGKLPAVIFRFDRQETRVALPMSVIADTAPDEWVEVSLDGLVFLAREMMAGASQ